LATTCQTLLNEVPDTPSGVYYLDTDGIGPGAPYQAYCLMSGGIGWMLVMQTSSNSAYTYANAVWSNASAPVGNVPTVTVDQDLVSNAFYTFPATQSLLCLGDLNHCAAWTHASGTARNLAAGAPLGSTQTGGSACTTLYCGPKTFPIAIRTSLSVWSATSSSSASRWYRFGYLNVQNAWGTKIRLGFSGDGDSSDSQDTIIGLGLNCTGNCVTYCTSNGVVGMGSGFHAYQGWATAPKSGRLRGFLFVHE
jgi:hypothetical protein